MAKRNKNFNLKAKLIEQAMKSIRQGGVRGLSIRAITSAARVTPMAAYRYFENKEALLAAIVTDGLREFAGHLQKSNTASDTQTRLIDVCEAYVNFARENRHYFEVIFGNDIRDRRKYPELYAAGGEAFEVLIMLVKDCQKAKTIDPGLDTRECAAILWAQIHGVATLLDHWKTSDRIIPPKDTHTMTAFFIRQLLEGIGEVGGI